MHTLNRLQLLSSFLSFLLYVSVKTDEVSYQTKIIRAYGQNAVQQAGSRSRLFNNTSEGRERGRQQSHTAKGEEDGENGKGVCVCVCNFIHSHLDDESQHLTGLNIFAKSRVIIEYK